MKILPLILIVVAQAMVQGMDLRVTLPNRISDPRDPGMGDFQDCRAGGPCQAVLLPRTEPDEKIVLPRNQPREELAFLSLKGFRAQGGDPITTVALRRTEAGESLFVDFNNDEDLGNDGPARWWAGKDSCVTAEGAPGRAASIRLCRAGGSAEAWRKRCEGMKKEVAWARCEEDPYRLRVIDIAQGTLASDGKVRKVGLCDLDGDGRIRLQGGDRLLIDWDGDGVLEKSLDGDGFALPAEGPFRFSVDRATYVLKGADEDGSGLSLERVFPYAPEAELFKAVEGRPAPDFRFVNMDGDTVRLSDFRGQKVLLQFWSVLCKPCIDQFPSLRAFDTQFKSKNWRILSITTDKELELVQQATLKHRLDWTVGMAGPEVRGYYGSHPLPLVIKIDPAGIVEKRGMILGGRAY